MRTAADVMVKDVVTIRSAATIAEAFALMQARGWRALVVERLHDHDAYGMITETDILFKVAAYGRDPRQVRVYEVMTKPCLSVPPELGVDQITRLMAHHSLHRVPVIQGELLGIISASDLLTKSEFIEAPQSVTRAWDIQQAIAQAEDYCRTEGVASRRCLEAWRHVENLQAEAAHHAGERLEKTAFDEFCAAYPEILESATYAAWCSG